MEGIEEDHKVAAASGRKQVTGLTSELIVLNNTLRQWLLFEIKLDNTLAMESKI